MTVARANEARSARLRALALAYAMPLNRYFARRGLSRDAVEDCTQEVFLRLARADDGAIENAEAYLFTIASAVLIDRARRARAHRSAFHVPLENLALDGGEPGPARVLEGRESLLRLSAALALLPGRTREMFLLNRLEGVTYTQLAARFGVTVKAVEKQMSRALLHIRKAFADENA